MAKQQAEWSNRLKIFWLKKNGYLPIGDNWQSGGIKWTYGNENESSISFIVSTNILNTIDNNYIKLSYTQTNRETAEKENMDYKIQLTTTPCNYGGVRYWFICPLYKNGKYCGRRVGVLFSIGKWFGCRHCGEITYALQMESGKFRWNGISIKDIAKAEKEVKRYYYKGKPTRKYRRLIKLNEKFENNFIMVATHLDKRSSRFAELKK